MSAWAIFRVKDELDVLPYTLEHMLTQVDHVLVEDNGSTDGTREMLQTMPVEVVDDPEVAYYQSQAATRLAEYARLHGATWVISADADEVWLSRTGGRIADVLNGLPRQVRVVQADLWDHVATAEDPDESNPLLGIGWRRSYPAPLCKVACRTSPRLTIEQGNHHATYVRSPHALTVVDLLTVRHFAYRSPEQTVLKIRNGAAAYAATDLAEDKGAHWRGWGAILAEHGEQAIIDLFHKWHWREHPDQPLEIDGGHQPALVYDPAPVACQPVS